MTLLVAFDWNGTIVNDVERAAAATSAVLQSRGLPGVDAAQFRDRFRLPLADFFAELGIDGVDRAAAESEWNEVMAATPAPLSSGVGAALTALRKAGARLGVISAASEASVHADSRAGGLDGLFDFVTGSCHDKVAALARLVDQHDGPVVYVGDTEYDMSSARMAGAVAIGYGGGYRPAASLTSAGASTVIESMAALAEALALVGAERRDRVVSAETE